MSGNAKPKESICLSLATRPSCRPKNNWKCREALKFDGGKNMVLFLPFNQSVDPWTVQGQTCHSHWASMSGSLIEAWPMSHFRPVEGWKWWKLFQVWECLMMFDRKYNYLNIVEMSWRCIGTSIAGEWNSPWSPWTSPTFSICFCNSSSRTLTSTCQQRQPAHFCSMAGCEMKVSCRQRSRHWKGPVKWIQNDINFRRSTIFQLSQHIPIQCLGIWQNNKCLPLSFLPVAAKDVKVSKIAWVLQLIMHILSVKKMLEFHSWTCPRGMKLWSRDCAVSWIGPHGPMEGWTTTGHVRFAVSRQVTRSTHKYLPTFFGIRIRWKDLPHVVQLGKLSALSAHLYLIGSRFGHQNSWHSWRSAWPVDLKEALKKAWFRMSIDVSWSWSLVKWCQNTMK